ncbi:putative tetratricopeptide repeat protein 18-like [Trypanosoma theileri]|uniref:Putative tetratricopeptide repeat protein 18-like n=1 Tax=Trypanosoma theileri TaxID=67003 RepID=A0A1X0NYW2_9TRYP|nr:putative tetratricopeptide repeat protein 18-like [Trypanosoma theileri]ORC89399.1 putative tetratricopeptide repeat protein 18-like [Trypanosoma theileri]
MSQPDAPPEAVNYMDVKLHDVHNIPANWWAEGKPPGFPEHPFRYEVSFTIDGEKKYAFTHGRLLLPLSQYESYIEGATPPPLPSMVNDMLQHIREVPETPVLTSGTSTRAGGTSTKRTDDNETAKDPKILWVITPAADAAASAAEEQGGRRRKKGLAASTTEEVVTAPSIPNEDDLPPCVIRVPLYEDDVTALDTMLLSGRPLQLHFTRVLKGDAPHDWEDPQEWYFRADIPVDLSPLAEPGSLQLMEDVPLLPVKDPMHMEEKVKKRVSKRPKSGSPGLLFEEVDVEAQHPYVVHNTSATVSVRLEKTLTRLAMDRIRPALTPANLIPTRALPKKEFQDTTRQFTDVIEAIAKKLMYDYRDAKKNNNEASKESIFATFQTTGQLAAYKEQLTPLVVKVVREKFLREPDASQEAIGQLTNELYVYLLNCVHAKLRDLTEGSDYGTKSNSSGVPVMTEQQDSSSGITGAMWLERAEEAETLREYGLAAQCHQARIATCHSPEEFPDLWNDAAAFFARVGDATRAEQCYREAIAYNPLHVPSLLGYGDLLLEYSRFDEAAVFLHAAVDIQPSALSWGHLSLLCDLHVLALEQGPQYESKRARWEREGMLAMKEAMGATEEVDFNDVNLSVAEYLLQLHHTDLANVCLSRCRPGGRTEVLYARLFALCERYETALGSLKDGENLEPFADEINILTGDCNAALGRREDAISAYMRVLCREGETPKRCFGPSYIHLGNLLIGAGRYNDALGVFTLGIQAWPCSVMWLGAGIAYYRMRKIDAAEECLSESNTLNNSNPRTWAYLALVCLRKERAELEVVLQQAITQGLSDAALLTELGRDLVRASRLKLGELCLRKAFALEREAGRATSEVSCTSMYYLAGALEGNQQREAKELYTAVVKQSKNEVLRAKAEEELHNLSM